jgi:drug/metabolite transporter (DMT)-like permease
MAVLWPLLVAISAALQIVRNAAQRSLTPILGVWGATYVRFLYGLPFALVWLGFILTWRGMEGGPSWAHFGWSALGASCQAIATALLVMAMRDRAFAVANALQKTEVLGAALVGVVLLGDGLGPWQWAGIVVASIGVALTSLGGEGAPKVVSLRAAAYGMAAGLFFSFSSVSYRAAGLSWGEDLWVGAAMTLATALTLQTLGVGIGLALFAPQSLKGVFKAWRPSLVPGATGAIASALLFTAFAFGPSAGAVKAVQLIDVLIAWFVSRRIFKDHISPVELAGGGLVLVGVLAVVLAPLLFR